MCAHVRENPLKLPSASSVETFINGFNTIVIGAAVAAVAATAIALRKHDAQWQCRNVTVCWMQLFHDL